MKIIFVGFIIFKVISTLNSSYISDNQIINLCQQIILVEFIVILKIIIWLD